VRLAGPSYAVAYLRLARRLPHASIGTCEIAATIPRLRPAEDVRLSALPLRLKKGGNPTSPPDMRKNQF
jgi:hypothetical protein